MTDQRTLGEAWAAAEAALPDGWTQIRLDETRRVGEPTVYLAYATAPEPDDLVLEWVTIYGPFCATAEAALLALVASLAGASLREDSDD